MSTTAGERAFALRDRERRGERDILNFVVVGDFFFAIGIRLHGILRALEFEFGLVLYALQHERMRGAELGEGAVDGLQIGARFCLRKLRRCSLTSIFRDVPSRVTEVVGMPFYALVWDCPRWRSGRRPC